MSNIKLTIITVCYNAENCIKKTFDSLLNQTFSDYEYLIIDGASKDKTLLIIEEYKPLFVKKGVKLRVISEPDKGIYDAMNKGIKYATGEWIEFFNAGTDYTDEDVLSKVMNVLNETNAEIVHGDFIRIPFGGRVNRYVDTSDASALKKNMNLSHESCFFNRLMHKKYPYNTRISIVADYNSVLKMYLDERSFYHLPFTIVNFYEDGFSSQNRIKTIKQAMKVRMYNNQLSNTLITRIKIELGLYSIKEKIYYDICPAFITNLWEKIKDYRKRIKD